MSVLDACKSCRKAFCLVPCTPEIGAEWARLYAESEERELRFQPPTRKAAPPKPFYRDGVVPKSVRHETVDKLR